MSRLTAILLTLLFLTSCAEIRTTRPEQVYKYWSGSEAPSDLELMKGQYLQSAHWTREYKMYLKIKPSENWSAEFISQNQLQTEKEGWTKPTDAPSWFDPTANSIIYSSVDDFDQGSRYFRDTLTNEFYIYEIQL